MDLRTFRRTGGMVVAAAVLAGCGVAAGHARPPGAGACHTPAGRLADTLYVEGELSDAAPPRPRPPHLAPYPPAADGDFRIRFRDAHYYAWGMPVRVTAQPTDYRLVRIGQAGIIPVYTLEEEAARHLFLWAPITEDCVFLRFKHESEMS